MEMSSERKTTTHGETVPEDTNTDTNTSTVVETKHHTAEEMYKTRRKSERNERRENHPQQQQHQQQIKKSKHPKPKSKFIHLLLVRLSLWLSFGILPSRHLKTASLPMQPHFRFRSRFRLRTYHYTCCIIRILRKLYEIKTRIHLNYRLRLTERTAASVANSWIGYALGVGHSIINDFKHKLTLIVIVHLRRVLGICPIRLISLKRLQQQQIPKNHLKLQQQPEQAQLATTTTTFIINKDNNTLAKTLSSNRELATQQQHTRDEEAPSSLVLNNNKLTLARPLDYNQELATLKWPCLQLQQTNEEEETLTSLLVLNKNKKTSAKPIEFNQELTILEMQLARQQQTRTKAEASTLLLALNKDKKTLAKPFNSNQELATLKSSCFKLHKAQKEEETAKPLLVLNKNKNILAKSLNYNQELATLKAPYLKLLLSPQQQQKKTSRLEEVPIKAKQVRQAEGVEEEQPQLVKEELRKLFLNTELDNFKSSYLKLLSIRKQHQPQQNSREEEAVDNGKKAWQGGEEEKVAWLAEEEEEEKEESVKTARNTHALKELASLKPSCLKLLSIQQQQNPQEQQRQEEVTKEAKESAGQRGKDEGSGVSSKVTEEVIQLPTHYRNNKHYLVYGQPQNEHKHLVGQTQRQRHHHQQQQQEHKCQHILFARCSWQICGFPLVSKENIFKYLPELTERTFGVAGNNDDVTDNSATLPRIDDNGPDNGVGGDVLATATDTRLHNADELHARISGVSRNASPCANKYFTKNPKTSSCSSSRTAPASSCAGEKTSTTSFPSSRQVTSKSAATLKSSTRRTSTTTKTPPSPYCRHYHHSNFHIKLPSLLLLGLPASSSSSWPPLPLLPPRTTLLLVLLLLLSSMWHTSEAFHGSVKLSTNTIKTKYGLVRGIVVRSSPLVEAYLGIPYASPPVGSLRFMPPITPSTWKNVRNADRFSAVCPQTVPIPPNGPEALLEVPRARLAQLRRLLPLLSNQSEDCLYLNIYVPYENRRHRRFTTNSGETQDQALLPTVLFLHGESYEWNSGNPYDGSELAAHGNVIVVTINFRLGIFGFLKTGGKESAQGNFGLMDLVAGLHWLKENLPAFGGDPQAITVLGHGTGAALANILVVSPVASDLIQNAALVSGSALSPWAIQKNPLFVKRRVAEQTGCHGDMLYDDLAPCLRTKSVAELLSVKIDHPRFLVGFAPFIDGTVISPNTDSVGKLSLPLGSAIVSTSGIEYANFPKRNLIFCLTSVESHLDLSAQDLEFGFNETRRDRILRTYVRNNFHYHLNEIFAVLKNEYTDWEKAIRSPLSSRDATLQFLSDGHTASSLIKLGYMHSLRGGKGYFLHFKHRTVEEEYPQRTGSVRGEDVPFWLGLPISPLFPHNYTTQERQISRLMLRYLANFAKTGNPNQSSLSSPIPSSSTLIGSRSSATASNSNEDHQKYKRSSLPKTPANIVNASSLSSSSPSSSPSTSSSSSGPNKSSTHTIEDVATAAAREALNLAVLYNQRRTKRTYFKRHSRSNTEDQHNSSGSGSSEVGYFLGTNGKLDGEEMPFWDAYDVVNQLYMELGNKAEIQSHYRGHKLSMWLNLIPQLHRHANMNDQSMRHHQFQDDLNNMNLYEGIVRPQIQTKPADDDETLLLPKGRPTPSPTPTPAPETNTTQKPSGGTTECGVDGAMFVAEMTTAPPSDNRSFIENREKEMATASTGLIGNLEVLRRLSGKQFQSYTTALVATVAVGCFLLILNILIFAGIYHQREKRARDAKTKEELQDNDNSKNSSMLKLNAMGSESGSFNGSGAGVSGKTTVVFGEYSCYDEKSVQTKDEKLMVELPPSQMMDSNWAAACSTSTLDLLKTKHHLPMEPSYPMTSNIVPITTEQPNEHLMAVSAMEMATYNPLPAMVSGSAGLILDPSIATSSGLQSKRGSFVGSSGQLNQYDFASVQSSDQMSFKDIENAVKVSMTRDDDITQDDDIPEPPPPPKSFQNMQLHQQQQHQQQQHQQQQHQQQQQQHQQQQHQQQQHQQQQHQQQQTASGPGTSSGGGILRQSGTSSATQTGGGKKRVHIQEISV